MTDSGLLYETANVHRSCGQRSVERAVRRICHIRSCPFRTRVTATLCVTKLIACADLAQDKLEVCHEVIQDFLRCVANLDGREGVEVSVQVSIIELNKRPTVVLVSARPSSAH